MVSDFKGLGLGRGGLSLVSVSDDEVSVSVSDDEAETPSLLHRGPRVEFNVLLVLDQSRLGGYVRIKRI